MHYTSSNISRQQLIDSNKTNLLFKAVFELEYDDFIQFISRNHTFINTTNKNGETLLHHCAYWGKVDKLEALIGMGAEISTTNNGSTLLHYCISSGIDAYLMTDLIKHGFSLLAKNNQGRTPIHYGGDILMLSYIKNWLTIRGINSKEILDNKQNTFAHTAKMMNKFVALNFWRNEFRNMKNEYEETYNDVKINYSEDIQPNI